MKTILHSLLAVFVGFAGLAFMLKDPQPDWFEKRPTARIGVNPYLLTTSNKNEGHFKSEVHFSRSPDQFPKDGWYGFKIKLKENEHLDEIWVGITDRLISKLELKKDGVVVHQEEKGFVGKMTWGGVQTMALEFCNQRSPRYQGKPSLALRLYERSGFFGDIASLSVDLSPYGNFTDLEEVVLFSQAISDNIQSAWPFTQWSIWNRYKSFD